MFRAPPEISLPIDDAAVAVLHRAVADDDVLDRHVHAPAVVVAAGLERDAVVAGVEGAALDQHVAARLRIAAVVVRAVAADRHVAHRDVLAEDRMDLPHRRVDDRDALDEDVAAAVRLDEVRPQPVALAEDALARPARRELRGPSVVSRAARLSSCRRRHASSTSCSASAWPSSVPVPVIAMFSASNA